MKKNSKSTSIRLSTILFLIFLTLKLAGIGEVATWSWWWVTSPLWIPIVFVLAVLAVVAIVTIVAAVGVYISEKY